MSEFQVLEQARMLLFDRSTPFNQQKALALDIVTQGTCSKNIQIIQLSNKIWAELQADPEFWTKINLVLQFSQNNQTKFLALKILEEQIKQKWGLVAPESRHEMKMFILEQMLAYGRKPDHDKIEDSLLNQINIIIIQILKYEWRTTWTNFIPEICEVSRSDQNLCENSLKILRLLSQEIFDYSKNQMTSQQIVDLKSTLNSQFELIFNLCFYLLQAHLNSQPPLKESLVRQTLETLYTYLSWIPFGFIFLTNLVDVLILFFDQPVFRNESIRCLSEIVLLKLEGPDANSSQNPAALTQLQNIQSNQKLKVTLIFEKLVIKLRQIFPYDFGFVNERQIIKEKKHAQLQMFDDFCSILTLFFTGLFQTHLDWLEKEAEHAVNGTRVNPNLIQLIEFGLGYLICFSALPIEQNYKVCAEFWYDFTKRLLEQPQQNTPQTSLLNIFSETVSLQRSVYPRVLNELRRIVVSKMAKPQEVLISIDESGVPYKEELTNTENNAMYDLLKDLLINLAKLSWSHTREIITQKLDKQVCLQPFMRILNGAPL